LGTARLRAIAVGSCLFVAVPLLAAGPVRVAGLQVVGPGLGANGTELQPFHQAPGLTLALAVEAPPGKAVIEIDTDECVVEALADDRGTNLLESVSWGSFPDSTEDGRQALVEVTAQTRPAAGVTKVQLKGSLKLVVAAGIESEKIAKLELEPGQKVKTLRGILELVELAGGGGDEGATITFGATSAIRDQLKEIRFFGADGQPIEIWGRGSMSMGDAVQLEFSLKEKPTRLSLELDWWKGLDSLTVPFDLAVGLGLSE
jgi:hypothetical protein